MQYVKMMKREFGYHIDVVPYAQYLQENKDALPEKAYAYAAAPWHFRFTDHRCPHDAWLRSFTLNEEKKEGRVILNGTLSLLMPYHDFLLDFKYSNIEKIVTKKKPSPQVETSHGDLLFDELVPCQDGLLRHEILFTCARYIIVCSDFDWELKEINAL